MATADFPIIAGSGLDGTLMVAAPDMRASPEAADVVARFRAQGYEPLGTTLNAYATVQVWAQAVAAAASLDPNAVIAVLHNRQFDTVLGKIGFDAKGDVTVLSRGNGSSGRRMAPTSRWSKVRPTNGSTSEAGAVPPPAHIKIDIKTRGGRMAAPG